MSTFEEYDVTCENYDSQRVAIAAGIMGNMLGVKCSKPLKDIRLLDAGCGTGNYAKYLINYGVGHVTLLDASAGMLKKAKSKLTSEIQDGRVEDTIQATLPAIPVNDGRFDAVMFNLVLHHLVRDTNRQKFAAIQKALTEARRVLNQDGVLCITSVEAPWIYFDWYSALKPEIADRYSTIFPSASEWEDMVTSAGFRQVDVMAVYHKLPLELYNARRNPDGPTVKTWRDTDSYWAYATPEDLQDIESNITEMKKRGVLQNFVDKNDKTEGYYRLLLIVAVV